MSDAPRIFISYARADGLEYARELRARLESRFSLWHDIADLHGGDDWWRQVTDVIDHVQYVILLLTEAALGSEWVRREWRYARQQGRCVRPVFRGELPDTSGLAAWMRQAHMIDTTIPEQWEELVADLAGSCAQMRVPVMADRLPFDYVPRVRELAELKSGLLSQSGDPVAVTAALRGAGGYGKTTLARALCHDDDVQDAFHDGILWVTLGEAPGDLASRVEDLIVALTGQPSLLALLESRKSRMAELLADRAVLLVIDDVWNASHLQPFLLGGERCARLITTRNADALPRDVHEVLVHAMQDTEAVAMLRAGLPPGEDASLRALTQRLGEWPLLLKMVNRVLLARVQDAHDSLAGAVQYAGRVLDKRGLTGFDARDAGQRSDAVSRTLGVSLELLSPAERDRFQELAVFPEDVDAPIAAVQVLWRHTAGLDEIDTEDILQRLHRLSLLLEFDLGTRRIRLHDVIRAWLRRPPDYDSTASDRILVEAYRAHCPDGWAHGPNDGYFFQQLPMHLWGARLDAELRGLLLDLDWVDAKLRRTDTAQLLRDYDGFAPDVTVRRLGQALRLSAAALERDPAALLPQLLGRIPATAELELAHTLRNWQGMQGRGPWLRPLTTCLTPPGGPLLQTFAGHRAWVNAVAVTPDGARVLSASFDHSVKVWDLLSGRELATLTGHTLEVNVLAVTPDGRLALSGGGDGLVRVWELPAGREIAILEGHTNSVTAVCITANGKLAITGGADGTVRMWTLPGGESLGGLAGHEREVHGIAVAPDDACAITASYDGLLKVWDLASRSERATLRGHDGAVCCVAVTPDGTRVVSGGDDRTLRVWALSSAVQLMLLEAHTGYVSSVTVTHDGSRVISGSGDGTVRVWDLLHGRELAVLQGHTGGVLSVAVTPDDTRVLSSSFDSTVKVWELSGAAGAKPSAGHTGSVNALACTPDGARIVSGGADCTVRLWNSGTGEALAVLTGHDGPVNALAVTPDGARIISGAGPDDGTLSILGPEGRARAGDPGQSRRVRHRARRHAGRQSRAQRLESGNRRSVGAVDRRTTVPAGD